MTARSYVVAVRDKESIAMCLTLLVVHFASLHGANWVGYSRPLTDGHLAIFMVFGSSVKG